MRLPSFSSSADTLVKEYGLYHFTRLSADPSLPDLATLWDARQSMLASRVADHQKAHSTAMISMAVRDGAAATLASAVRGFYGALVTATSNNRKSPLFGTYFPDGLNGVLAAPLETQVQRVGVIISQLGQEQDKALAANALSLGAAHDALQSAMDAYRDATSAEEEAFGLVEQEKAAWFDRYKYDHKTLSQTFYKEPKRADSYFKPARKAKPASSTGTQTGAVAAPAAPALVPAPSAPKEATA